MPSEVPSPASANRCPTASPASSPTAERGGRPGGPGARMRKRVVTGGVHMTEVHGEAASRFSAVRDAFAANFAHHGDVGAAVSVYVGGEKVVDLWAGIADQRTGRQWEEDTLQLVFSTTKGATAACAHLLAQRGEL